MSIHQYATLDDTLYFWFASNDTSGSGDDGATPLCDVREAGATISDAPILSPTPAIISNAAYPAGCHEVAVAATIGNGFAADTTYAVFCALTVDSQNPTGFVGSFTLSPVLANSVQIASSTTRATDLAEIAQYLFANTVTLTDVVADGSVIAQSLATGGDISGYVNTTDAQQAIRDSIEDANPQNHASTANNETTGTLDSGTYANTATVDTVYYQTSPVTPAVGGFGLNVDLTFSVGVGRIADQVVVTGYFDSGARRTVQVWAYDYNVAGYVQLSSSVNDFGNTGSNESFQYPLTTNMTQTADGAVSIRFTSESTTVGDDWFCDYVNVTSVSQGAGGLTADAIQYAVWARTDSGHDEETLGYSLSKVHLLSGQIISATDATKFILDAGVAVDSVYVGMSITLEDKTDDHYETRRIIAYTGSTKEVTVDRAFGFTPVALDDYYLMNGHYTPHSVDDIAAALNDISVADIIAGIADGTYDLQEMLRIMFSVLAGRSDGGGTATLTFADPTNSKTRLTETVTSVGNRTAVALDGSSV